MFFWKKKKKKATLGAGMLGRYFWTTELTTAKPKSPWYEVNATYSPVQVFIPSTYDRGATTTNINTIILREAHCPLGADGEPENPDSIGVVVKNTPDLDTFWEFKSGNLGKKGIFAPVVGKCLIQFELIGGGNAKIEVCG